MAMTAPICDFGWNAPDFTLQSTDQKWVSLDDIAGPNGTVVMFICNHCPYVLAVLDRLIMDAKTLSDIGITLVAINSNDAVTYPADSFENMQKLAIEHQFPFAYLHDHDQSIARAYNAACTPDFFGFNADLKLQYRGRLDAAGLNPAAPDLKRDLVDAMRKVAETGSGPEKQVLSMGCSIKWKN